jgi:hypothetical protein
MIRPACISPKIYFLIFSKTGELAVAVNAVISGGLRASIIEPISK